MDSDLTNSTPQLVSNEETTLKLASELAAANLLFAQQEIGHRIIDPTITTKALLDIAEHSFKVSGMAKKQEAKADTGRFVFNIHFSGSDPMKIEKVINPEDVDDTSPEALAAEAANVLVPMVSAFPESPEFS